MNPRKLCSLSPVLLAILLATAACSATGTVRPERSGKILDSETMAPLAGVSVNVETWMVQRPDRRPTQVWKRYDTVTAADGTWHVPSNSDFPPLGSREDPIPLFMDLYEFTKPGYVTRSFGPKRGMETRWTTERVPTTLILDRRR